MTRETPSLGRVPLFDALEPATRVVIAGAGGGFDVYAGVPLMIALQQRGKAVQLANYSFASTAAIAGRRLTPHVVEVTADSAPDAEYLPERELCRWFRDDLGREVSVQTFAGVGVAPLTEAYRAIVEDFGADALVLVDGGTDSLMRGDEAGLGTPAEDATSLAAAFALDGLPTRLLLCLGFGVDAYHGVSHAQFLEAVAALQREGAFLGAFSVLPGMPEADAYVRLVDHAHRRHRHSIVNGSIASAIEGAYGDVHRTDRTAGSVLWIQPLMSLYFAFELAPVAARNLYLDRLRETDTLFEVVALIEAFRKQVSIRRREPIPV